MLYKQQLKVVNISDTAKEDLEKIVEETIDKFGKIIAAKLLLRFQEFINLIAAQPNLFGYYLKSKSIRKFILTKNQLVLYKSKLKEVEIITIVYSKQNPRSIRKKLK